MEGQSRLQCPGCLHLRRRGVELTGDDLCDLPERMISIKQVPNPRTDRVEAVILLAAEIEDDHLVANLLVQDLRRDPHTGVECN